MVGSGSGQVWFELYFDPGGLMPLYDPAIAAQQLIAMGRPVEDFFGLTNSFLLNCRGKHSSHGFFLVRRGDIDRLCTNLTAGKQQDVSLTIRMQGSTTAGGVAGHETVTKQYTNLSVAHAYAVTGVVGSPAAPTSADLLFDAQKNSSQSSWQNQLYVLHVVDDRYWYSRGAKLTTLHHNVSSPYHGAEGHTPVRASYSTYGRSSSADTYSSLISSLTTEIGGTWSEVNSSYGSANITPDNFNFRELNLWDALWELLDEINHTVVISSSGVFQITRIGDATTSTTTERNLNKPWLTSISNDISPNFIPRHVYVNYPAVDNQWHLNPPTGTTPPDGGKQILSTADLRQYKHTYVVEVDPTTFSSGDLLGSHDVLTSGDCEGGTHDIQGRMHARWNPDNTRTKPSAFKTSDSAGSFEHPDNQSDLEANAKDLAIEYVRTFLRPEGIFNETYQGFLDFTPTVDLSSILWSNTGGGATTRITNLGVNNDEHAYKAVPSSRRTGNSTKKKLDLSAYPSHHYEKHRQLLVKLGSNHLPGLGDGVVTILSPWDDGSSGDQVQFEDVSEPASITVHNPSLGSIPPNAVFNVWYNDQADMWIVMDSMPSTALAKVGVTAIAATSAAAIGTTIASQSVELLYIDSTGKLQTTGETIYAFNIAKTAIAANSIITVKRSLLQAEWVVDMEICPIT